MASPFLNCQIVNVTNSFSRDHEQTTFENSPHNAMMPMKFMFSNEVKKKHPIAFDLNHLVGGTRGNKDV